MLKVVNAVARNLSVDRPEMLIYTLAYASTQKPPTITKPEANVVITLTTMDDGWAVPLTNTSYGPSNSSHAQFLHDLGVWSMISEHLWIWDYTTGEHQYYDIYSYHVITHIHVLYTHTHTHIHTHTHTCMHMEYSY